MSPYANLKVAHGVILICLILADGIWIFYIHLVEFCAMPVF